MASNWGMSGALPFVLEEAMSSFGTVLRGEASDKNRKLEIDGTILTLKIYRIINWWKMRNLMDSATIIPCHQHIIEVSMSVSFNVWSWRVDQIPFTQSKAVLIKKIWRKHADIELRLGLKNLQLRKREYGKVACPCTRSATGQDDSYSWGQGRASWCQSGSPLEHTTLTNEQPQLKWCQQLFSSFVCSRVSCVRFRGARCCVLPPTLMQTVSSRSATSI